MPLPFTSLLLLPLLPLVTLVLGVFLEGSLSWDEWVLMTKDWSSSMQMMPQLFQQIRDEGIFADMFEGIKGFITGLFANLF